MKGIKVLKSAESGRRDFVVQQLLDIIKAEKLSAGAKLPAEPELADMFGVSRTVVREAMQTLQATGTVRIEQGRGTFLADNPLAQPFSVWATMNTHRVAELFAVRAILEEEAARLAAMRRTPAHIETMAKALERGRQCEAAADWRGGAVESDVAFHRGVTQAAGLPLLQEMLEVAIPVWIQMTSNVAREKRRAQRLGFTRQEHEAVFDAIVRQDPEGARRAMHTHLGNSRDRRIANDLGQL